MPSGLRWTRDCGDDSDDHQDRDGQYDHLPGHLEEHVSHGAVLPVQRQPIMCGWPVFGSRFDS